MIQTKYEKHGDVAVVTMANPPANTDFLRNSRRDVLMFDPFFSAQAHGHIIPSQATFASCGYAAAV